MKAKKVFTIYGKYSDTVVYEYRGKKYEVEYAKDWTYGNGGNPALQHREAQERIDREIAESQKPKKPVKYEDTAEYGLEMFWKYVEGDA